VTDFLKKISDSINNIGVAPYDYKKTEEYIALETRKVVEHCGGLTIIKKENDNE